MMRLLRNKPGRGGICKYALIRTDKLTDEEIDRINDAPDIESGDKRGALAKILTQRPEMIEFGWPNDENEFFVLKLKDKLSRDPLLQYSTNALCRGDRDLATDVKELANRAGDKHRNCKMPD